MAAHRLGEAWRHCFWAPSAVNVVPVGNSFSAYRTTEFLLKEERRGDVTTLYTILPSPMLGTTYLLMADIQSTATCKSEITVWSANSHWRKRAEFTAAWLDNPEAKGSGLDCKR